MVNYRDNHLVQGLDIKESVRLATTESLLAYTYVNVGNGDIESVYGKYGNIILDTLYPPIANPNPMKAPVIICNTEWHFDCIR